MALQQLHYHLLTRIWIFREIVDSLQQWIKGQEKPNHGCYTLLVHQREGNETISVCPTPTNGNFLSIQSTEKYWAGSYDVLLDIQTLESLAIIISQKNNIIVQS